MQVTYFALWLVGSIEHEFLAITASLKGADVTGKRGSQKRKPLMIFRRCHMGLKLVAGLLASIFSLLVWSNEAISLNEPHWYPIDKTGAYELTASGGLRSQSGASVTLVSVGDHVRVGGGYALLSAEKFVRSTVTLTSDIHVTSGVGQATLWMRADGKEGNSEFVNTALWPVSQDDGSSRRKLTIDVPSGARKLFLGVLLTGNGQASFSSLRLSIHPLSSRSASVNPEKFVSSTVEVIRQNALNTSKVDWPLAITQVSEETAGAQITVDTYPAIRKLLKMLGDNHSFLSNPYQATSLRQGGAKCGEGRR